MIRVDNWLRVTLGKHRGTAVHDHVWRCRGRSSCLFSSSFVLLLGPLSIRRLPTEPLLLCRVLLRWGLPTRSTGPWNSQEWSIQRATGRARRASGRGGAWRCRAAQIAPRAKFRALLCSCKPLSAGRSPALHLPPCILPLQWGLQSRYTVDSLDVSCSTWRGPAGVRRGPLASVVAADPRPSAATHQQLHGP
jgi:hypothetical protein